MTWSSPDECDHTLFMDRRQHVRFDLSAPVSYVWRDQGGVQRSSMGVTRDVSATGVFVVAESSPPAGEIVQFEVLFSFQDASRIQMRSEGRIVRVDDGNQVNAGFAVAASTLVVNGLRE
jgi:c-di-GMP-binding flagellar brake protein YcgR